jgi:6-phosphofructokinase 1
MSLIRNCIIAQSGGPTAVINSSLAGVIQRAIDAKEIGQIFGAKHGILGIIDDQLIDLSNQKLENIELLKITPSSFLGSCRYKLKEPGEGQDYQKILDTFIKHNIGYFFYIGGNDSMDTADKLSKYIKESGYEIKIIGIPKTVDNDLVGTDHCPGFGSAAKYIATTVAEIYQDANVYPTNQITIIEIMGRNAGWLTASSVLADLIGKGPDLIYLPEISFSIEKFKEDVARIHSQKGNVIICASEGIKDSGGNYIAQMETAKGHDAFGHAQLGGVGNALKSLALDIEKRVKVIELSLMQRSASHIASETDINEAFQVGQYAVKSALQGKSDSMVCIVRQSQKPYAVDYTLTPLCEIANHEKKIPLDWINEEQNGVNQKVIDYILPLIQGLPELQFEENGLPKYAKI